MDISVEESRSPLEAQKHQEHQEQHKLLEELELQIGANLRRFLNIGCALQQILAERLYLRVSHSFGEYCLARFGFERAQAYRLIAASQVMLNIQEHVCGVPLPVNERQLRPLTRLEPDEQIQAWLMALELSCGLRPTARQVEEAVAKFTVQAEPQQTADQPEVQGELDPYVYGFELDGGEEPFGDIPPAQPAATDLALPDQVSHGRHLESAPSHQGTVHSIAAGHKKRGDSLNMTPKGTHEEKLGYWKNRALNAEQERDRLMQETAYLRNTNRELSLKLLLLNQLSPKASSG